MQTIYLLDHTYYKNSYKDSMLMIANEDYDTVCNKLVAVEAAYDEIYDWPCTGLEDEALKVILNKAYGYEFISHEEVPYRKIWIRLNNWFDDDDCNIDSPLNYKLETNDGKKCILQYVDIYQNWEYRVSEIADECRKQIDDYINDSLKKIITETLEELNQIPKE